MASTTQILSHSEVIEIDHDAHWWRHFLSQAGVPWVYYEAHV